MRHLIVTMHDKLELNWKETVSSLSVSCSLITTLLCHIATAKLSRDLTQNKTDPDFFLSLPPKEAYKEELAAPTKPKQA